jgi:hypothetical protein
MKLVFFIVIYVHCFACTWWFMIRDSKVWVLPKYQSTDDWYQLYTSDLWTKYVNSIYVACQMLGGVDQQPRTGGQVVLASFGIFFGAIINANIFGEITVIMQSLGKNTREFETRQAQNNTAMINLGLPPALQQDVRNQMYTQETSLFNQRIFRDFLAAVPPSVQYKVISS